MNENKIANGIAKDLIDKFPNSATRTLAKIAYDANPKVFKNYEQARSYFRYLRGQDGSKLRRAIADKSRFKVGTNVPFGKIPKGLSHFEDWKAFHIDGPVTAVVIADTHIPFHDRDAILVALKEAKECNCNLILLNGDILDCFAVSRWDKDPRKRDFKNELQSTRQFIEAVRDEFPKARIVLKIGNHEERYESYLFTKAPEVLGVDEFELRNLLHCDKYGVEVVKDKRPIALGKLFVLHGHEYKFPISNPVNAARGLFLRAKVCCLGSHMHKSSQHSESNLEGDVISTWSTGCLCDRHPDYRPINDWNLGFAIVEVDKDSKFQVNNYRIIDGKAY